MTRSHTKRWHTFVGLNNSKQLVDLCAVIGVYEPAVTDPNEQAPVVGTCYLRLTNGHLVKVVATLDEVNALLFQANRTWWC